MPKPDGKKPYVCHHGPKSLAWLQRRDQRLVEVKDRDGRTRTIDPESLVWLSMSDERVGEDYLELAFAGDTILQRHSTKRETIFACSRMQFTVMLEQRDKIQFEFVLPIRR